MKRRSFSGAEPGPRRRSGLRLIVPFATIAAAAAFSLGMVGATNEGRAAPPPVPAVAGQVSLSPSGNDPTCSRHGSPCSTFKQAYRIAHSGDTVVVHGGEYAQDSPSIGGNEILPDPTKTGVVTFICAGDGDVTFAGPVFNFWAGLNGVMFQGDCFHFHVVYIGEGGYSQQTSNIILDGVHMDSFQIQGADNVNIENSEVGPFVACYEPGDGSGAPSYANCPGGSYWASQGGTYQVQQEPFVHNGDAGEAENITLANDVIHGISSTWSDTHTGGLLFWGTKNLHIIGCTFTNDAIYDILENQNSTDSGLRAHEQHIWRPRVQLRPKRAPPRWPASQLLA